MSEKPVVLIFGKLPPPYMGPAIATEILLHSSLGNDFNLLHIDTKTNEDLKDIGSWSLKKLFKNLSIYRDILKKGHSHKAALALIPISQSTLGFLKDSIFILLSRLVCKNVLLHLRGSEFKSWMMRSGIFTRLYVKLILSLCKGVIVLGHNLRYLFEGYFPGEKIFVVPNGGDYSLPARQENDSGKVKILYLGNLQASKGIEDVMEALAILPVDILSKIKVDVIGGWRNETTRNRCLETCTKYRLPVQFHAPDKSPQKLQFMVNADIFVFPPRAPEGHPWVIIEALAAGLPIISTDRGAIVESVENGVNGYIVPLESPASIAVKLEELIRDPEKRQRMGHLSRKKFVSYFTETCMVNNLKNVFFQVLTH